MLCLYRTPAGGDGAAGRRYRARLGKAADHAAEAEVREDRLVFQCVAPVLGKVSTVLALRPSLSSRSALAWAGRDESAAEGDRSNRAEHHREHQPRPGERQTSAEGDAEAE